MLKKSYLQVENRSKIFYSQAFYLAAYPESSVIQYLWFNCIVSYNYNCTLLSGLNCIRGNRLIDIKFDEAILESTSLLNFQCLDSNCTETDCCKLILQCECFRSGFTVVPLCVTTHTQDTLKQTMQRLLPSSVTL